MENLNVRANLSPATHKSKYGGKSINLDIIHYIQKHNIDSRNIMKSNGSFKFNVKKGNMYTHIYTTSLDDC